MNGKGPMPRKNEPPSPRKVYDVAKSFFTDGQAYESLMGRWSRAVGNIFLDWLSLPKALRWLEVGCGTGAFTELVLDRCAPSHFEAIDPSENQIAYARNRPVAAHAIFRVGDAQSLPCSDKEYDVVVMALVISFVPNASRAIAEMKRVTRPGGTVATYMWDTLGGGYIQQPLFEGLEAMNVELPPRPGQQNSRMDDLRRLFEEARLDQVAWRTIEIEVSYETFDEFWSAQTGIANAAVQAIRKLSDPDLGQLKAYLQDHLPRDHRGRIAYSARANAIKGIAP